MAKGFTTAVGCVSDSQSVCPANAVGSDPEALHHQTMDSALRIAVGLLIQGIAPRIVYVWDTQGGVTPAGTEAAC